MSAPSVVNLGTIEREQQGGRDRESTPSRRESSLDFLLIEGYPEGAGCVAHEAGCAYKAGNEIKEHPWTEQKAPNKFGHPALDVNCV